MEDVERDFEIPKTPVPMNIPSWGIPVPATLGKLSYLKLYDILIDHPCSQGLYRIQPSQALCIALLRSIYRPATYLTYSLGLQAIIVIALLANAYESASSKLEGLTTA